MSDLDLTDAHAYCYATSEQAIAAFSGLLKDADEVENGDSILDLLLNERDGSDIACTNVVSHVPWAPFQSRIAAIGEAEENPIAREEEIVVSYVEKVVEFNLINLAEVNERDGLSLLCGVDPSRMTEREMLEEAEARLRTGASGIFISPTNSGIDGKDRGYQALFDYCQDVGAPILCAPPVYEATGDSTLGRAIQFGWTIRDFPRSRVIFAALGWVPELADNGERDLLEAIGRLPDVCVDLALSLSQGAPHKKSSKELAALISRIGAERVLFATGSPFVDPKSAVQGFWDIPLPDLDRILIGKENWRRLTS